MRILEIVLILADSFTEIMNKYKKNSNTKLYGMFKNLLLTIGLVLTTSLLAFSQSGTLKGTITDGETGEPIPFANIIIEVGGAMKGGASTDFDGNFTIKPITPGTYTVKATCIGYKNRQVNGVIISADKIQFLDVKLNSTMTQLEGFEVIDFKVPLISKDQTSTGGTATAEEIAKMPNKTAGAIATTVGGVKAADGGDGEISIRGQRSSGTVYYIDGMKVTGSNSLPESAIDQVSVILGGVPAQYGDATGGIISVTTKGPSRKFGAGVELQTSQFLDAFGYNRASANLNGPLIKGNDDDVALLGYFLAGEVIYRGDNYPSATGVYQIKDEKLKELKDNPLMLLSDGQSVGYSAYHVRKDDLVHQKSANNNDDMKVNISGKIDVKTSPTMNLSFGGSYSRNMSTPFNFGNTIFNYDANYRVKSQTYRIFGRFSHRFEADPESSSLVKNVFYNVQADYQHYDYVRERPEHGKNLFDYGYIGKFETYRERFYDPQTAEYDSVTHITTLYQSSYRDTAYTFTAGGLNPDREIYTNAYYRLANQQGWDVLGKEDVATGKGLLNGTNPTSVNTFNNYGYAAYYNQPDYSFNSTDQFGVSLRASADVGNHALQFGFIYEQKTYRGYNYNANDLWTLMRGVTNSHIEEYDLANPESVMVNDTTQHINYNRLYDGASQKVFDKALRAKLGLAVDGTEWIDIDSYDAKNNTMGYIDADGVRHTATIDGGLSIDMFSPEELITLGNYASAYGYDYYGNKLDYNPSMEDFINGKKTVQGYEVNGFERDALRPTYAAGYIQDKFAFRDLIFNVGLRVDRFDANQPTLKDPYLLYAAKTVSETSDFSHPGNMGDDYVVYVDNKDDVTQVMGYRNGDTWYNADGIEVANPAQHLDAGNGVTPYLKTPGKLELSSEAFEDYKPQYSFMPRIAFSFPISDEALFFAHYDVLTQRPANNWAFNADSYFFWPQRGVSTMSNPNLRPEQTIDYEIGFQQKLTETSSMTIAAFYREVRDQIQAFRFTEAYPSTYYGFNNIDFGTIKGLTLTYDLRRTKNVRLKASYTLQFAKATGSTEETQKSIIQAGLPNLRTLLPTNQDQRHALKVNFDYRFGEGKNYNGPSTTLGSGKVINWLENTGLNITFWGGSGTPYTKSSATNRMVIDGSINGARLPSTYRFDGRIDRDFLLVKNDKGGTYINVYLQVLNILNTKNVLQVYPATGVADDDGYLADDLWQNEINSNINPQAYRELYTLNLQRPWFYSAPRQIRVGLSLNF